VRLHPYIAVFTGALLTLLIAGVATDLGQPPPNRVYWLVVHHAASGEKQSQDVSAAEIDTMHRARGFDCIGYNYVVRLDGTVEKGRAEDLEGAHVRAVDPRGLRYNTCSIGVCFAGNCDLTRWTPAQQEGGYALLHELMRRYNVPPERVVGHDECGMNTHCPGELIDMDAVRARLRREQATMAPLGELDAQFIGAAEKEQP
jgi:N-acetylmuramoyl-L-alanine amidase